MSSIRAQNNLVSTTETTGSSAAEHFKFDVELKKCNV